MSDRAKFWIEVFCICGIVLLCVELTGCGLPVPPHDCETSGGLYVLNAKCDASLDEQLTRIAQAQGALGYDPQSIRGYLLIARTDGLDARGGFVDYWGRADRGLTNCDGMQSDVAVSHGEPWRTTALAHEMFHVAQGCPFDGGVRDRCLASGQSSGDCDYAGAHAHWGDPGGVLEALVRINAAPPAEVSP